MQRAAFGRRLAQTKGQILAQQVSICGDCGHAILFVDPTALKNINEHWGDLQSNW
jgi:hypothetical protein